MLTQWKLAHPSHGVIPKSDAPANVKESVATSLINFLNLKRFKAPEVGEGSGAGSVRGRGRGRGSRFNIQPGQSVSEADIQPELPKVPSARGRKRGAGAGWSASVATEGIKLKLKKN